MSNGKIIFLGVIATLLGIQFSNLAYRFARCPKCRKRGIAVMEKTRYWKKLKCRSCGCSFVEESGH